VNLESIKIVCRECPESLGLTETRLGKTPFEVAQIYEPQRTNHAEVLSLLAALTRAFQSGGAKEVWGITGLPLVRRRAVELRITVLTCMTYGRRENATDEAWANMHGFFHGVAGRDMYAHEAKRRAKRRSSSACLTQTPSPPLNVRRYSEILSFI
jgi:hypothetical protein